MYHSSLMMDINAKCPYYKSEYKNSITCEGIVHGSDMMTRFKSDSDKQDFAKANCMVICSDGCMLRTALNKKYS